MRGNGTNMKLFFFLFFSSFAGPRLSFMRTSLQFKAGMKLIQQAYEDRHQSLIDEVNKWKWISEEQSVQVCIFNILKKAIVRH